MSSNENKPADHESIASKFMSIYKTLGELSRSGSSSSEVSKKAGDVKLLLDEMLEMCPASERCVKMKPLLNCIFIDENMDSA